jgi:hypothetical protein
MIAAKLEESISRRAINEMAADEEGIIGNK